MLDSLRRLYRAILLPSFGVALLAIMWTAVSYQVRQEKLTARHEAVQHSQSLARTLAEHTNHLLRQTDHATQLLSSSSRKPTARCAWPNSPAKTACSIRCCRPSWTCRWPSLTKTAASSIA